MEQNKRYYWLKLQDDFFSSKRIKKLRKLAGGDTFTIIYLKMQLKSLKSDGILEYTGIEDTFAKEVALDIDEDEENVQITISYLLANELLVEQDGEYKLPYVELMTGSETATAQRVRDYRNRQKTLQCNTDVTQVKQLCNVEIDKEKEINKEIEINKKNTSKKKRTFTKPSIEEVKEYVESQSLNVNPQYWYDYYESNGWKVGKNAMKDWQATLRRWSKNEINNMMVETKKDSWNITKFDL